MTHKMVTPVWRVNENRMHWQLILFKLLLKSLIPQGAIPRGRVRSFRDSKITQWSNNIVAKYKIP